MKNLLLLGAVLFYVSGFSQDVITLKNGDEIKGKIIKVGVSEIEYKRDTTSPEHAIKKSEVFMIKYENGSKEVLTSLAANDIYKQSFRAFYLKYGKHKRAGKGLLVTGGLFLIGGSVVSPLGGDVALAIGLSLMGASIPLIISGGTEIHKYLKCKRQWKEQQRSLSFAPEITSHSYGAALRLTF